MFFLLALLLVIRLSEATKDFELYTQVSVANGSDSLNKIKHAKFVEYTFNHDSISGRLHMGILGPEAQRYFPDSIDVVSSYTIPNKDKTKGNIVLTNFPVVDKNVVFMHGMVALQELMGKYDEMGDVLKSLESLDVKISEKYQEIERSLNSEISHQMKEKLEIAEYENEIAKKKLELEQLRSVEDRLIIDRQLEEERKLLEYEAELSRARMLREEEMIRESNAQLLALERELAEKREAMKRSTSEALQAQKLQQMRAMEEKKLEYEKEKIRLELQAKAEENKANEEAAIRKISIQSKQDTDRMIQGIKAVSNQVTVLMRDVFSRPKQLIFLSGLLLLLLVSYYLVKELLAMLRQFIQAQIGRPSLVRETSYHWSIIPVFLSTLFGRKEHLSTTFKTITESFQHIILSKEDKERVINLAVATRNTRNSDAPYRHVLLHGPPGTGKTLIARKLAQVSGMDYAIMSGGDVAPLGEDAVNQLHSLFRWAAKSRKGLLVFIDEAEAFLSSRTGGSGDSQQGSGSGNSDSIHMRNALNALLYQTGTPSKHFMLVLATNRPADLDSAVLDRMDISLQISLPGLEQRVDLVKYYWKLYVTRVVKAAEERSKQWLSYLTLRREASPSVDDQSITDDVLSHVAIKTSGFSGREIAKLFIAVQYAVFLAENQRLTLEGFETTVSTKIKDHVIKTNGFLPSADIFATKRASAHTSAVDKSSAEGNIVDGSKGKGKEKSLDKSKSSGTNTVKK